ncbi:MAG TPA: M48 family metallopeptidase [Candidatus Dormibacteraeota bacterium]
MDFQRPNLTATMVASVVIALVIHVATLSVLVGGAFIIVTGFPHPFAWLVGLPLLLLGLLLRPRLGGIERGTVILPRESAPNLYGLVDRVAAEVGAKPVDLIALDSDFNASHGRVGLRRQRVLWLGLAMWNALNDQERIALLSHEMAHQVNGDLTQGFIVGSALRTLAEWQAVLRIPPPQPKARSVFAGMEAIAELLAAAALRVLRAGVARVFELERSLLFASSQRAEYFADLVAARVGSNAAALSLLDRLYIARQASQAVVYAARREEGDVWAAERTYLNDLSPKEWERQRRLQAMRGTSIDATHPPTNLRIELLKRRTATGTSLSLSATESRAIEAELESGFDLVAEHLKARFSV